VYTQPTYIRSAGQADDRGRHHRHEARLPMRLLIHPGWIWLEAAVEQLYQPSTGPSRIEPISVGLTIGAWGKECAETQLLQVDWREGGVDG
jgi:hypothetical protein